MRQPPDELTTFCLAEYPRARHHLEATARTEHRDPDVAEHLTVQQAVRDLPSRQRAAVVLRYLADLPVDEVASIMDVTPQAVRSLTRGQRLRVGASLVAAIMVATAVVAGARQFLSADPLPVIGSAESQKGILEDGRVSWREYRIAVAATAACLKAAGVDDTHRFDEEQGRFRFDREDDPAHAECAVRHLGDVATVWWDTVGPDGDGVTWQEFRSTAQATLACLDDAGIEGSFDRDLTNGTFSVSHISRPAADTDAVEAAVAECREQSGIAALERGWNEQIAPSPQEDRQFYGLIAHCMRDRGHDAPDAAPDTLSSLIEQNPEEYDQCWNAAYAAYRPYVGTDAPTEELERRLLAAQQQWDEAGPDDYRYVSVATLGGVERELEVTVQDGDIVTLVQLDGDTRRMLDPRFGITIDNMFESLLNDLRRRAQVEATFDPNLGYPTSLRVVTDAAAADGTTEIRIIDFARVAGTVSSG